MRTIRRTNAFKRDYKREKKGRHRQTLDDELLKIVTLLASDMCRFRNATATIRWPGNGRITGTATSSPTWC